MPSITARAVTPDAATTSAATGARPAVGGWLQFFLIGLVISIVRSAMSLFTDFVPLFSEGAWANLTTPDSPAYHALWAPLIGFEMASTVVLALAAWGVALLIVKRLPQAPKFAIGLLLLTLVVQLIDFALLQQIESVRETAMAQTLPAIAVATLTSALWIPYFLRSKRVKATFAR